MQPAPIQLKKQIDKAEVVYRECFEFLIQLKHLGFDQNVVSKLFDFQPKLATCLFELDEAYRALHQAKRRVIARKKFVTKAWFANKLSLIAKHQEALKRAIAIGKALGDSFAWLFYHKQRHFVYKHFSQEKPLQLHMPPGIGGEGEIAFIEHFKLINNHFVLYHGITNFLRLGDISLIDLKEQKLFGVGEIKTTKGEEDDDSATAFIRLSEHGTLAFNSLEPLDPDSESFAKLEPTLRERLRKQVLEIESFLESPPNTSPLRVHGDNYINELEAVLDNTKRARASFSRVSGGLIIAAYADARKDFSSRVIRETDLDLEVWTKRLRGLNEAVARLCNDTGSRAPLVTEIFQPTSNQYLPMGATPLMWLPIADKLIKKMLFLDVRVFTMFCPNYLFEKMRAAGYKQEYHSEQKDYAVSKEVDGKLVAFFGLKYFIDLIAQQLCTEDKVVELLNALTEKLKKENAPTNIRIDLNITQEFF